MKKLQLQAVALGAVAMTILGCNEQAEPQPRESISERSEVEQLQAHMASHGLRTSKEGDVGLFAAGIHEADSAGLDAAIETLWDHGIWVALPEEIRHGESIWSVSPDDFHRAIGILEAEGFRERYPRLAIARLEEQEDNEQ